MAVAIERRASQGISDRLNARGREDMKRGQNRISERLARARAKFADFDVVWQEVRSQVPRAVLEEIGALANGLDAGYYLRRNPTLCAELVGLPPEQARDTLPQFRTRPSLFRRKSMSVEGIEKVYP